MFPLGTEDILAVSHSAVSQLLPNAAQYRLAQTMVDLPDRSRSSMGAIGTLYQVASEWEARQKSINSDPQIPMVGVKRKFGSRSGVEALLASLR
jgi:hypothetical protein